MKLRIDSKILTLRLSPQDIELLKNQNKISESLKFANDEFIFSLEYNKEVEAPKVRFRESEILVGIPEVSFLPWLSSMDIEFDFRSNEELIIRIDKDLKPTRKG